MAIFLVNYIILLKIDGGRRSSLDFPYFCLNSVST